MAATPEEIESLRAGIRAANAAIASGEKTITHNGKSITYRSVFEMIRARDDMKDQLRIALGGNRGRIFRIVPAGRAY